MLSKKHIGNKNINIKKLKILFNTNIIIMFMISAFISNTYIKILNKKYEKLYSNSYNTINTNAVITSKIKEKDYTYKYTVKIKEGEYKNKKLIIYVKKNDKNIFNYGDRIKFEGTYFAPDGARNYKGFNYREYLKTKKVYGTVKVENVEFIKDKDLNILLLFSNSIRNNIIEKIKNILPKENANLLTGILLGIKDDISEDVINNFKNSSLSHVLAVSGMHTTYLIMRNDVYFKKIQNIEKMGIYNYRFCINFIYVHNKFYTICNKSMPNGNNRNYFRFIL